MEWTKEELFNCVIQINNQNHSNRILKFFQEHGYFLKTKANWKCPKNMVGTYIGPSIHYLSDIVHMFYPNCVLDKTAIKLPSKPRRKFPREMIISDDKIYWRRMLVVGKVKSTDGIWVSKIRPFTGRPLFAIWQYAKEIN
jgi:hypothetical protein